jgi:hypothetical protein
MASRSLRKTFFGFIADRKFLERIMSERYRESIYNYKVSKVNALRKWKLGV